MIEIHVLTPVNLVCQVPRKWWSAAGQCGPTDGVVRAVPTTVPTSVAVAVRRGCGRGVISRAVWRRVA